MPTAENNPPVEYETTATSQPMRLTFIYWPPELIAAQPSATIIIDKFDLVPLLAGMRRRFLMHQRQPSQRQHTANRHDDDHRGQITQRRQS